MNADKKKRQMNRDATVCRKPFGTRITFGVGVTLWSEAVIAEVCTLNSLPIVLTLIARLLWRERQKDRHLLLSAFLVGTLMEITANPLRAVPYSGASPPSRLAVRTSSSIGSHVLNTSSAPARKPGRGDSGLARW